MYIFNNHVMVNLRREERNQMFNASLEMIDYFESLLLEGTETGEFVVPDPRLYANNIVTLVFQWATRRWFTQKQYTLSQYSKELTEYILKTTRPEGSKSDAMKVTGTLTTAPSNHVSGD
jgi:hypothetical protein